MFIPLSHNHLIRIYKFSHFKIKMWEIFGNGVVVYVNNLFQILSGHLMTENKENFLMQMNAIVREQRDLAKVRLTTLKYKNPDKLRTGLKY